MLKPFNTIKAYVSSAAELGRYWGKSRIVTLFRMALSRIVFGRGPPEFDKYQFASKPLSRWRDYVIEVDREALQRRVSPVRHRQVEEDKLQFWRRCVGRGLPTIPVTALVTRGEHPSVPRGVPVAGSAAELEGMLRPLAPFAGFAKPLGAGQGYGAFPFDVHGDEVTLPDGKGDIKFLFEHCARLRINTQGYLFQPRMLAHPGLRSVMPGPGLGSLRLVTFLGRDGRVEMPWVVLKSPGRGAFICHPRLGALLAPVDPETGRLGMAVGPTAELQVTRPVERHPETGARYQDVVVPEWAALKEMVVRAAREFDELPCLGWDIAVTTDGPVLIETNWKFATTGPQVALGRGLRAELQRQMDRCMRA